MIITDSEAPGRFEAGTQDLAQLQAAVSRYCLSLTGSPWDAEDLAQDTWLKAVRTLEGPGHANPEALLLRIAKTTWIDQSRRSTVLEGILKQERVKHTPADHGAFEIEAAFQALVRHLPSLQRTVFLLRDVLGYSAAEAAGLLGTTEGAVKAALYRARQSLKAVRQDLERDALPLPQEEGLKAYLRALAAAYRQGDIEALVELAQRDAVEPAVAVGQVQSLRLRKVHALRQQGGSQPTALMAA